jgi:LPS-assembly protein
MQRFLCIWFLPLLLSVSAQEDAVLPPNAVAPPAPVEIPPVPSLPDLAPPNAQEINTQMPTGVDIAIKGKITPVAGNLKKFLVSGPIELKTNSGEEVFADRAELDLETGTYTLLGNVSVFNGPMIQRGDRVVYDLKSKKLNTTGLSVSYDPIILESGNFEMTEDENGERIFVGTDAGITTNDVEDPAYWLRADRTTLYPGDKIVFNDLKLYIGETPIFWLPYLSQPLNAELGYRMLPGGRTNWGVYLLQSYGIMLGGGENSILGTDKPWLLSRWHFDMRARRGIGAGVDLFDTRVEDNPNLGWLKLYFMDDMDPSIGRSGIPRGPVDPSRYRAQFQYRIPLQFQDPLDPDAEYALNYDLHLLSDNHFLEDFDPRFYRNNAQPDNTIFLTRRTDDSLLTGLARLRLNDFYRADSRSPEISFDQIRRPIFGSRILHEGQTSFGVLEENMADPTRDTLLDPLLTLPDGDPELGRLYSQVGRYEQLLIEQMRALPPGDPRYDTLYQQLTNPQFMRFHTYQELSTQYTFGNWLHLTPHIGGGYSRYFNVAGPAEDADRTLFSTGLEASVKFHKDYPDIRIRSLGVDGLRHTMQPYANWSYLSAGELGQDYPSIDRMTFFTRPAPINVGRFPAIDDLDDWNLVRLGVRNRLVTQRNGASYQWLFMDTYIDSYVEDPELQRDFSNLYNDITWLPLPWLAVDVQTQFPIISSGSGYSEFTTGLRFMPTPNFEFSVQQRTLSGHPYLLDSNRVNIRAYNRFNENWGAGLLHQWEFDDGTLELEQYTLHRNYENWIVSAGLTHRNNRTRDEYGFLVSFTLKDFPDVSMPFRIDAE